MERIAPAGDVYQAGTLSGNPLAVAAGLATLARLDAAAYDRLGALTDRLAAGFAELAARPPAAGRRGPGLVTLFFSADAGARLRRRPRLRHRGPRALLPRACSTAASTRRPRSSRPGSSRWPTTRRAIDRTLEAAGEALERGPRCERPGPDDTLARPRRAAVRGGDVISPHVLDPDESPPSASRRRRAPRRGLPGEYTLLVEAVREGYLLHYASPACSPARRDLALLAGDYLYALGLERLASWATTAAVAQLADLISLCAELHAEDKAELTAPLWLACVSAVGGSGSEQLDRAKGAARALDTDATKLLWESAEPAAGAASDELARASEAIKLTPLGEPGEHRSRRSGFG